MEVGNLRSAFLIKTSGVYHRSSLLAREGPPDHQPVSMQRQFFFIPGRRIGHDVPASVVVTRLDGTIVCVGLRRSYKREVVMTVAAPVESNCSLHVTFSFVFRLQLLPFFLVFEWLVLIAIAQP